MVTYLSIIGRLLRGLGVPVLFVGRGRGGLVLEKSGVLLWPCGHSKLYPVAAAGVVCRGGVPFMAVFLNLCETAAR